jgi:putative transposase
LKEWCTDEKRNIELVFIQKGKPTQNSYVERFNRSYREEVLDNYCFDSLLQAKALTKAWVWVYNNERPHSSLGYQTPTVFLLKYGKVHHPQRQTNFPTFQQDNNYNWKTLINIASD